MRRLRARLFSKSRHLHNTVHTRLASVKPKVDFLRRLAGRLHTQRRRSRKRARCGFGETQFVLFGEALEARLVLAGAGFDLTSSVVTSSPLAEGEGSPIHLFPDFSNTLAVGDSPTAIASSKFDDDTFPDLVTLSPIENSISILLGNGDGTFQESKSFAVGEEPVAVTIADFNADGKSDIATVNSSSSDVSVLLGAGQGLFASEFRLPVGGDPNDITHGDFNNDGRVDLLVLGYGLIVFLGRGDGTFEDGISFSSSGGKAVVAGDFDSNGNLDAAIVRTVRQSTGGPLETFHEVRIFHGLGDGTFWPYSTFHGNPQRFPVGEDPSDLQIGDFNNDGIVDVTTVNAEGVSLLVGAGDGTFAAAKEIATPEFSGTSVEATDFNADGLLDVIASREGSVAILLGDSAGDLASPLLYASIAGYGGYATPLDFNSDGVLDVAYASHSLSTGGFVALMPGNGNGTLQAPHILPGYNLRNNNTIVAAYTGANGDFNGDGNDDLVGIFQNDTTANSEFQVRYGSPDRMLNSFDTAALQETLPSDIDFKNPGDVNGDGLDDLIVVDGVPFDGTDLEAQLYLANGDATFRPSFRFDALYPISMNFDGNNYLDFEDYSIKVNQGATLETLTYIPEEVVNGQQNPFCVYDENSNCRPTDFTQFGSYELVSKGPLPDFDGDGKSDGVNGYLQLLLSDDSDEDDGLPFFDVGDFEFDLNSFSIANVRAGDFNRDGKQDLVFAGNSPELSVYLGNGDGTFNPRIAVDSGTEAGTKQLLIGDYNNDQQSDVLVNPEGFNGFTLLFGNGDGTFPASQSVNIVSDELYQGDFDGDGWMDIAIEGFDSALVYFNVGGGGPRGDEARAPRVTDFGGEGISSQVTIKYTLPEDSSRPVTLTIVQSSDDALDEQDKSLGAITVTPDTIISSGGTLQLINESANEALDKGSHELLIDASAFGFLTNALGNANIQQLFAFGDATHANALDRGTFAPFRGFHLTADNRAVLRTGPGSKDVMIAKGNPDELTFSFELADAAMPARSATASTPGEILIVASSSDDFIHVQHDVTTDTIIRAGDGVNMVVGGAGNDNILGGADTDVLLGEGFDIDVEVLRSFLQNLAARKIELVDLDVAHFGAGQDTIDGGDGFDVIFGGPGDDELRSGAGGGILFGDGLRLDATLSFDLQPLIEAPDLDAAIKAFPTAFELEAGISLVGEGTDSIYGGSGIDLVLAGAGNDIFFALPPEDTESADGGTIDVILGNDGDDTINDRAARFTVALGGADNDAILGSNSGSFLIGGDGNDTLGGGDGIDVLLGDTLDFGVHSNIDDILAGFGNGKLSAGFAVGPGDENIKGDDVLSGGRGFDFQVGGYGNDYLEGGEGTGLLFGDSFSFSATLNIGFEDAAESDSQNETERRTKSGGWLSKALSLFSVDVDFSLEGTGDDTIIGSTGLDLAFGGSGEDHLFTGGGTVDLLFGNEDNDELRGGGERTQLTELVETVDADAVELRELGDRIRNKETLRVGGLDDSKFSIMVGGSGSDTLIATPAEDGIPADIGGSVLLGDDFRFLGIPTTFTDIFTIEFNGRIPVFFGIQFGIVQNGIDHEGEGQDILEGAAGGFNLLMGGDGDDTLTGNGFFDILMGDSLNLGADVSIDFRNVSLDKTIEENFDAIDTSFELPGLAGTGADTIRGGDSFTIAIGGDGPDDIRDEGGAVDLLFGNNGDDEIHAGTGFNLIVGGRDTKNALTPPGQRRGDFLVGGRDATNVILGDTFQFNVPSLFALNALKNGDINVQVGLVPAGQGDDIIQGGDGLDLIIGGAGDDIITGGDGTNAILGDSLTSLNPFSFSTKFFQAALSVLFGDPTGALDNATNALGLTDTGDDRIFGGDDIDIVFGGNGNDKIFGRDGFDFLVGGGGDDEVFGEGGRDIVLGGLGADELHGGEGDDHLESEEGADSFFGEEGNDRIFGGIENDSLFGGPGDDELFGEDGDDTLDGGTGNNTFIDNEGSNTIIQRLAADDTAFTTSGVPITLDVLANDGNGVDDILLASFTQPTLGSVARDDRGTPSDLTDDRLIYTPPTDSIGVALFTYEVRTPSDETDNATVSITVDASEMDFGDAPELFGYPTSLAMNGARHAVGSLRLGSFVDSEIDAILNDTQLGTPYIVSIGDDAGGADEDGIVTVSSIVTTESTGTTASLAVTVSEDGKLDGWIDFDHDGVWSHTEQVFASRDVHAGMNVLSVAVPVGAIPGTTQARFRLSSAGALLPTGSAPDGEVEDYSFTIVDGDQPNGASLTVRPPVSGTLEVTTENNELVLTSGETELIRVPVAALSRVQIFGADGDDTVAIGDVEMVYSGLLAGDAGQGYDTLRLSGSEQHVDLAQIDETLVRGVEAIDARGSGNNSVALTGADIARLSPPGGHLRVITDAGDDLEIGVGWSVDSTFVDNGDFIRVLKQDAAILELVGPFDWSNPTNHLDVNADGIVAPIDVLIVINELNGPEFTDSQRRLRDASSLDQFPGYFFDTSRDGVLSPLDALLIINRITSNVSTIIAEGEVPTQSVDFVLADIFEPRHYQFDGDPLNGRADIAVDLAWTSTLASVPRATTQLGHLSHRDDLERVSNEDDLLAAVDAIFEEGDFL
ncbi:MAG: VCBS repeat-containing protein [Planctomycetaceae bacterium]|nr:VCBS repeat-containing protein [Planctomycetales bacterium]MCB9927543.1 VCBS repeat-containing protein [Planctomycetaceae bacterium]